MLKVLPIQSIVDLTEDPDVMIIDKIFSPPRLQTKPNEKKSSGNNDDDNDDVIFICESFLAFHGNRHQPNSPARILFLRGDEWRRSSRKLLNLQQRDELYVERNYCRNISLYEEKPRTLMISLFEEMDDGPMQEHFALLEQDTDEALKAENNMLTFIYNLFKESIERLSQASSFYDKTLAKKYKFITSPHHVPRYTELIKFGNPSNPHIRTETIWANIERNCQNHNYFNYHSMPKRIANIMRWCIKYNFELFGFEFFGDLIEQSELEYIKEKLGYNGWSIRVKKEFKFMTTISHICVYDINY